MSTSVAERRGRRGLALSFCLALWIVPSASASPAAAHTLSEVNALTRVVDAFGSFEEAGSVLADGAEAGEDEPKALQRLAAVVEEFAAELGVAEIDTAAIHESELPPDLAYLTAEALSVLLSCHRTARAALPEVQRAWEDGLLFENAAQATPRPAWADTIGACGEAVAASVDALGGPVAATAVGGPSPLDLWPVLRFEPENGDDLYEHDYVLTLDAGGDDRYFNNAGGNLIDVKRGPPGSGALIQAPARGCQTAAEVFTRQDCVIAAAALLDSSGDDVYGRFEAPDPEVDAGCTADPLVRRILIQGSAIVGVGVLVDENGSDLYTGKVLTTGAGHINGFGHLRDLRGNDSYLVIRIGEGAATVGGTGTLLDLGGDDSFDFYIPSPLDPGAPNLTPGAGGVVDDQGRCDRGARLTIGAGSLGGTGHFRNEGGDDSYTSSNRGQGSGSSGGFGTFVDTGAGRDAYRGAPGRGNGVTLLPGVDNQGLFRDDG